MKKRKKPTGLIIALVILGGAAAGMNAFQQGFFKPADPAREEALAQSRKTDDSSKSVAAQAKSSLAQAKAGMMSMDSMRPRTTAPGQPLISNNTAKPKKYVPVPNDSSVSQQWYTPEAMKDTKKPGG